MPTFWHRIGEQRASAAESFEVRRRQREGIGIRPEPNQKLVQKARLAFWEYCHHLRNKMYGKKK